MKEKKYRTKKKICPYFPSSFKSSRNGVTSILFTLFLVTVFDDIKERKKITIPSTFSFLFSFFFFWKDQSNPLAPTNAPTAVSSFPIDFNLFFVSLPQKDIRASLTNLRHILTKLAIGSRALYKWQRFLYTCVCMCV